MSDKLLYYVVPKLPENTKSIVKLIAPSIEDGPWIAGGMPNALLTDRAINDVDVYVKNQEQFDVLYSALPGNGFRSVRKSHKAITYTKEGFLTIQLITDFYPSFAEVFKSFDFTVCQFAMDKTFIVGFKHSYESVENRELIINNISNVGNTLQRISKYGIYGYKLDKKSAEKYLEKITEKVLALAARGLRENDIKNIMKTCKEY